MINFRLSDLPVLLETRRSEGAQLAGAMESYNYGNFGWIIDPEGNTIELWESLRSCLKFMFLTIIPADIRGFERITQRINPLKSAFISFNLRVIQKIF